MIPHVGRNARLALGTAQFGMPYGIANQAGRVSTDMVAAILERAWLSGVDTLDTAAVYGGAEQSLGEIGVAAWRVVSKLPPAPRPCTDVAAWVEATATRSLQFLRIDRFDGLLLHRPQQLSESGGEELHRALERLKELGIARRIGVSVYSPEDLETVWPHFSLDLVQAPLNVLDRRLIASGTLERLTKAKVDVHIRSVFLQGLLLMDGAHRPSAFRRFGAVWDQWDGWLHSNQLTPLQGSLRFALSCSPVERVIVGVDSRAQFDEILEAMDGPAIIPPASLTTNDQELINPVLWSLP